MTSIGKSELLFNSIYSPEYIINKIDSVTIEDIKKLINDIFDKRKYNLAYVGNMQDNRKIEEELKQICFK